MPKADLDAAITAGVANAQALRKHGDRWELVPTLGINWAAWYYIWLSWNQEGTWWKATTLNETALEAVIATYRLDNGAYRNVTDADVPTQELGDLEPSILCYWALKVMGKDINSPAMTQTRDWILAHGGPAVTPLRMRTFLAMFRQYRRGRGGARGGGWGRCLGIGQEGRRGVPGVGRAGGRRAGRASRARPAPLAPRPSQSAAFTPPWPRPPSTPCAVGRT